MLNIFANKIGKPKSCDECPYKLGLIKTLVSPCPTCSVKNKKPGSAPGKKGKASKEEGNE